MIRILRMKLALAATPSNWMWSISGTQYSGYADYIRIYNNCEKFYNELKDDDRMAPSVVITG